MPLRDALRALLVMVLAALTLTLATPAPQADALVHAYTFDGHHPAVSLTYAITERGPPAANVSLAAYNADGPRPLGALACPEGKGVPASYDYDDIRRSVRLARGSQPVERPIGHERANHAVGERRRVAANAGRFELSALGGSRYQTPAGLIYGPGSKHGHRLTHVLKHGFPDATKKTHTSWSPSMPRSRGHWLEICE